MRIFSRVLTLSPQSIPTLIGQDLTQASSVGLQAPKKNQKVVLFGDKSEQPFELHPQGSAILPVNSVRDIYIKATKTGDRISIGIF